MRLCFTLFSIICLSISSFYEVLFFDFKGKLFRAVQRGHVAEVERLLQSKSVSVAARHELGWTALHLAAVNGRQEIVSLLLRAGAAVDAEEEFMNVYTTAREKRKHSLEVQIGREDEFSDRLSPRANFRGCTALHYAALADNVGVINTLLEAGADPLKVGIIFLRILQVSQIFWEAS